LNKLFKIAITGPESTGKSILSQELAGHYHTLWVPEYARIYLMQSAGKYNYDDLLKIARGQVRSEHAVEPLAERILFSDTELLVIKIWSEVKFGKCHPWIEEHLRKQTYDLYLLMNIDLPWEFDPLRENPENREFLFELYKSKLETLGVNYRIISGVGEERFQQAKSVIDQLMLIKT